MSEIYTTLYCYACHTDQCQKEHPFFAYVTISRDKRANRNIRRERFADHAHFLAVLETWNHIYRHPIRYEEVRTT